VGGDAGQTASGAAIHRDDVFLNRASPPPPAKAPFRPGKAVKTAQRPSALELKGASGKRSMDSVSGPNARKPAHGAAFPTEAGYPGLFVRKAGFYEMLRG
jgi:hypothetical protein